MNDESKNLDSPQHRGLRPFREGDDARRGHGPKPGAPNAGRPPDAVRAACREAFSERVPMLAELADTGTPDVRLRALDMLGRYGLGTSFTIEPQDRGTGVVILPALDIPSYQDEQAVPQRRLTGSALASHFEEVEYEYIIEEPANALPSHEENTVDPEIVRQVLAARSKPSVD